MYKIVDESILLFSRFYLSKLSLEALFISRSSLYFVSIKLFVVRYEKECEKSFFCKIGCTGE